MKLYNTLSRSLTDVIPQDGKTVRIYSCGPTVYDHAHIGNLSSFIAADTLRRSIAVGTDGKSQPVLHAMNFTDVDDKTIRRSREDYPDMEPMAALTTLTKKFSDIFLEDMKAVGNDVSALTFLRATDEAVIAGMRQLITDLHQAGVAYIADDGVYFSIAKYKDLGKQYGQLLELSTATISQSRIQNDEYDKDSVQDFALWKTKREGEPFWPFELDGQVLDGRPGWHIECSVMSRQALGQPFDIHTGGIDLIFPHHENEIAQSTALETSPTMATIFAHSEHILVDGKKMAKSAKNFYTLKDITDKGYDPLAFRLLVLQSHYRNQSHFSWENLEAAENRLKHWREVAALQWQIGKPDGDMAPFALAQEDLIMYLAHDLDTPRALMVVDDTLDKVDKAVTNNEPISLQSFQLFLRIVDSYFGLSLSQTPDITPEHKALLQQRQEARTAKDWTLSDSLRDQLSQAGIGVRDVPHGQLWFWT